MEYITSKTNEKIKFFTKLSSSSKFRKETSLFTLEGVRLCLDALESKAEITSFFFTEKAKAKFPEAVSSLSLYSENSFVITEELSEKLTDTQSPQGVFCVVKARQNSLAIDPKLCYIALDGIQDPSNLGALARTAEALGISGLILYNCCDIYNPKSLRASMGAFFRLPVFITDDLCRLLVNKSVEGMLTIAAVPDRSSEDFSSLSFKNGAICVIGNEGNGISEKVKNACSKKAVITMKGRAESLNAAAAGAILMWEMMR